MAQTWYHIYTLEQSWGWKCTHDALKCCRRLNRFCRLRFMLFIWRKYFQSQIARAVGVKLSSWPILCYAYSVSVIFSGFCWQMGADSGLDDGLLSSFFLKGVSLISIHLWNKAGFRRNVLQILNAVMPHTHWLSSYQRIVGRLRTGMLWDQILFPCLELNKWVLLTIQNGDTMRLRYEPGK